MGYIDFNNDQIFAMYELDNWWKRRNEQVFQISGGAGTGKTTCIMGFIDKIGLSLDRVLFTSYMGKAVCQMIRNGLPAKTIHSTCYTYDKEVARDNDGNMIFLDNGKPKMVYAQHLKDHLPKKIDLVVADEAFTIPEQNCLDLMSFGIPIVALGDRNQLPPPFGKPYFLENWDVELKQIMRQAEGDPIIYLAQRILDGKPLREGMYGKSAVIRKKALTEYTLRNADIVLTSTNRLRGAINDLFRESYLGFDHLEYPHYGEKIICRRNDWSRCLKTKYGEIYLTNGTTGFVDYVERENIREKSAIIDFKPDFSNRPMRSIKIDLNYLNKPVWDADSGWTPPDTDLFQYGYALTAYSAQGSQWDNTCVLQEENYRMTEKNYRRLLYSSITRAANSVTWVLPY